MHAEERRAALSAELDALTVAFERRALVGLAEPLIATPLTMQQLRTLTLVAADHDRATGHELAEALEVSVATMSGLVDRLVEAGMVVRRDDPDDRRLRRLGVTPAGAATLRRLMASSHAMPPAVLDRLSVDDLAALVQGLGAVDRALADLAATPVPAADATPLAGPALPG